MKVYSILCISEFKCNCQCLIKIKVSKVYALLAVWIININEYSQGKHTGCQVIM